MQNEIITAVKPGAPREVNRRYNSGAARREGVELSPAKWGRLCTDAGLTSAQVEGIVLRHDDVLRAMRLVTNEAGHAGLAKLIRTRATQ